MPQTTGEPASALVTMRPRQAVKAAYFDRKASILSFGGPDSPACRSDSQKIRKIPAGIFPVAFPQFFSLTRQQNRKNGTLPEKGDTDDLASIAPQKGLPLRNANNACELAVNTQILNRQSKNRCLQHRNQSGDLNEPSYAVSGQPGRGRQTVAP
ncbi:MAG: hypothetical protein HWE35_06675 [Rhodobacteraceae bacterium]|nr:hypothetical protein [Paracoccaceae bacterium]